MSNLELINRINKLSIENNEEGLLHILNDLFYNNKYKQYLQEVFSLISITEMYGYLAYLSCEELDGFLKWDTSRSQTYAGKSITFYNKGQLSLIFDFEKYKKTFLSAPTSFGKTSIVLEYIINNFKELKNVLFVVPTNSLLEELFQKITRLNKQLEMGYHISTQPYIKERKNNFLLLTPERFFLVSESIDVDCFNLIVMDETYKIVDSKNEMISDFLESRSLRFRKVADMIGKSNNKVIFLSPFTYNLTDSMSRFLIKYNIKKLDRKLEYVSRQIIKISSAAEFKEVFGKEKGYTSSLAKCKKTRYILDKLSNEKNIVYVSNYSEAYKIVDELPRNNQNNHSDRFNKFINHLETTYDIGSKYEWKIISALKKGVGIYVAPLPRYIKKEMIKLYEENELRTLIVTTAFTEGVNTNACNLIFTSLVNGPTTNKLSDIDILNVSGRAGRFAKSSIGKIYCIDDKVFYKVNELQNNGCVKLENYNYMIGNPSNNRGDYAIEMIDNEFLTQEESLIKKETDRKREELKLTKSDLNISLCVPTKWKLILYQSVNINNIDKLFNACKNILVNEPNKRIESLDLLFSFIRNSFNNESIDPFPTKPYEIKAFDNAGQFIWGRLYKIYCSGKAKDIINKNISFIKSEYNRIIKTILFNVSTKEDLKNYFAYKGKEWILSYFNDDLSLNYDTFYTETFKFINSVIQYKIPFYISFATSIVRLYIMKNGLENHYNASELDSKKAVLIFENGNISDKYDSLIDYGVSNDIIIKICDNKISYDELVNMNFDQSIFDEYELIVLKEFSDIMK